MVGAESHNFAWSSRGIGYVIDEISSSILDFPVVCKNCIMKFVSGTNYEKALIDRDPSRDIIEGHLIQDSVKIFHTE